MKLKAKSASQALLALSFAALVSASLPAFAHHLVESCKLHRLNFAPVCDSASADAAGMGTIKPTNKSLNDEDEDNTIFTTSFNFMDLKPNTLYTVAVPGAFGSDPTVYGSICSFLTNSQGNGKCKNQIVNMELLQKAELREGNVDGQTVLQATRQDFATGPGTIESQGCDDEVQMCPAP